ncbi:Dihydrofolate reductase-like domain-containing protein [Dioscorea alata]|uniref:Dihydrofolate reductase-like domain-containing protein n=1 Tax=Dioscorea alata TaxID=55571 RepID=A0ACB7TW61_DIOAL|nr:Dihydrofolate reductase-like domain-containing protein [Dioscorea alata]
MSTTTMSISESSSSSSSSSSLQFNSFELITSLSFNKMASEENYDHANGHDHDHQPSEMMTCADEFFQDGHLLPLPPRLQTPRPCASSYKAQGSVLRWGFSSLTLKKDVDPFMAAAELVKKEDMPWRCSQPHRHHCRTMSMDQPFITSREEWKSYNQQMLPLNFNNMPRKMKIIGSVIESKASNGLRLVKDQVRIIVSAMKKKENESTGRLLVHHNRLGKQQVKKKINRDDASSTLGVEAGCVCLM